MENVLINGKYEGIYAENERINGDYVAINRKNEGMCAGNEISAKAS